MTEEALLAGPLEPTNEFYAVAKIAGIKLCQAYRRQYGCNFISAMPTNLYGPNDNFDLTSSHVLPALIRKFHDAKLSRRPRWSCGAAGSPGGSFFTSTISRGVRVPDEALRRRIAHQRRHRRRPEYRRARGDDSRLVFPQARIVFDASKPDGPPRSFSTSAGCGTGLDAEIRSARASNQPTSGFSSIRRCAGHRRGRAS